jgi:polyhydroxyalkanoate synthesis regulator phasin
MSGFIEGGRIMEKYITDERTGLRYELIGDYYFIAGDEVQEERPIGIWGQRHLRYLKQHRKNVYTDLLTSGKLNNYLADLNEQAEEMFSRLVKELSEKEGITEKLKAENQMEWVRQMNGVRQAAMDTVNDNLIFS